MKKIYTLIALTTVFFVASSVAALTVSPAKLETSGDAGTVLSGSVKLFNESDRAQTFYTSFENFEPSDDSGTPRFVGAENGLATWMSATPTIRLNPQERVEVPFTITIPSNVDPGGYFAAIFFGTQPPANQGGKVSIGGRIGVLTLLRVNGDIPEQGGILDFTTLNGQFFYDDLPVEFRYRFSNDGGDRVIPRGDVELKNMFGSVVDTFDANTIEGNVLPSSSRRFELVWGDTRDQPSSFFAKAQSQLNNFHLGYYTAHLNLGWGFTNQTDQQSTSLLIIPWQLMILVLISLLILWFVLRFAGRSYKASLLKQFEAAQSKTQ